MLAQKTITEIEAGVYSGSGFYFSGQKIADVISGLLPYIFAATGAALAIYIVWGGISLMLSMGDPKAVAASRSKITTGIIGALVVTLAYFLIQLIANILNLPEIKEIFS